MSIISWTNALELGHSQIDGDHRGIVEMLNRLNDCVIRGDAPAAVDATIAQLDVYVREHFAREENLMDQVAYPAAERHKAEHRKLSGEFERLRRDYLAGKRDCLDSRLVMFLAHWWVSHIEGWDASLVPLVRR